MARQKQNANIKRSFVNMGVFVLSAKIQIAFVVCVAGTALVPFCPFFPLLPNQLSFMTGALGGGALFYCAYYHAVTTQTTAKQYEKTDIMLCYVTKGGFLCARELRIVSRGSGSLLLK